MIMKISQFLISFPEAALINIELMNSFQLFALIKETGSLFKYILTLSDAARSFMESWRDHTVHIQAFLATIHEIISCFIPSLPRVISISSLRILCIPSFFHQNFCSIDLLIDLLFEIRMYLLLLPQRTPTLLGHTTTAVLQGDFSPIFFCIIRLEKNPRFRKKIPDFCCV